MPTPPHDAPPSPDSPARARPCAHPHVHSHAHPHAHPHPSDPDSDLSALRLAFFLNLAFAIVEIAGGLLTNSLAILADALHDAGDSLTIGLAWWLEKKSRRGRDARFSYGYRRLSPLAGVAGSLALVVGAIFVAREAFPRLLDPQPTHAAGMFALALLGVAVNGFAAARLVGRGSFNARTVAWHLLEDVLGWLAVLAVSVALLFTEAWALDPLLSIAISGFVAFNVVRRLKEPVELFLQATPGSVDADALANSLAAIEGVRSVHHTHAWTLDGESHVMTTHLVLPKEAGKREVIETRRRAAEIAARYGFAHTTVEIEFEDERCAMRDESADARDA